MQKSKKVTTTHEELKSLVCDRCGKTDFCYGGGDAYVIPFKHEFGYGSPDDQDTLKFDICQDCLESMLKLSDVKYRIEKRYPDGGDGEYDGAI